MTARVPERVRAKRLTAALWILAGGVLLLLVLNAFFGGVYHVDSGSMEPTLHGSRAGGEWVLVLYDRAPELERFDLVVLDRPESPAPLVKRVVGLPGERVQIELGDLLIDGHRLGPDAPRPAPIPVFDQAVNDVAAEFHFQSVPDGPWSPVPTDGGEAWRVDAAGVPVGSDEGMMLFRSSLGDDWIEPDGERHQGDLPANDCVLELELRVVSGAGRVRAWVLEAGDTFELRIELGEDDDRAHLVLTRRNSSQGEERLGERELELARGRWHRLRLANVDNHVGVDLDGITGVLSASYASNVPYRGHVPPGESPDELSPIRSIGARAAFGAEGLVAEFRRIRVARDLFYVPLAAPSGEGVSLGPDEYFVLGDNSADSLDGRHWGPIRGSSILGRPWAVVWPPSRMRRLVGAAR